LPKRGDKPEWQHSQDYEYEKQVLPRVDFSDSIFSYHYIDSARKASKTMRSTTA